MTLLTVPDHEQEAHREDPAAILTRGGLEVTWRDGIATKKFERVTFAKDEDEEVQLPTMFLHMLDDRFKVKEGEFDTNLRAGNDNSEMQLLVPDMYTGTTLPPHNGGPEMQHQINIVLAFLKQEAMPPVSMVKVKAGGFSPKKNYTVEANPHRWYFSLKTSRPKANINLPKELFGIPEESEIYMFAENHVSVPFMSETQLTAFEECISSCSDDAHGSADWHAFATFLKIFFEGGFAYNKKIPQAGGGSFLPKVTGIGALGTAPSSTGQQGISTGSPYKMEARFLSFADSVPVTITAIKDMSDRHHRYGLCFTRCVWVWEDEEFERTRTLKFCSILPHGGFFYVPDSLQEFKKVGGLVYAFGEGQDAPAAVGLGQDAVEAHR